jgi:hypothetical protein
MIETLSNQQAEEIFGKFEYEELHGGLVKVSEIWIAENIMRLELFGIKIWCHKIAAPQFAAVITDVQAAGLIAEISLGVGGGCYNARHKRHDPAAELSGHSWGYCLDVDPGRFPYGSAARAHPVVISIFQRWGFVYGGDFKTPDPMHWEILRFMTC